MADLILGSIVSSITEQATSLISLEIGGAWGAKDELKKLGKTVEAIEAVLAEAEKRKVEVEPIKLWLKRLWNAVYEADDLLDDYSTEIKRRAQMRGGCNNRMMKEVRIFFSSSNRVLYNFKMAHRVKSIRETLDVINKERQEYNLGQDNTGNAAQDGRRYDMLKKKAIRFDDDPYFLHNLIGRGDDMNKICDRLLDNSISDENVSVVPIVGIGGLGKTSLAKLIYDDEKVKKYFGIRFWVCVSDNFDERIIMKKILQQYDGSGKPEDCIIDKLPKNIEGKKYLLVLDDVWNKNQTRWLNLMKFLRNGAKGSKILVTTRDEDVARTMTPDESYKLKGLSKEESLCLLMKMAYKKEGEWKNQRLEEIGTEIANKCCGVPLAIMTIARLLCSKDTDKDWEVFNSREFANIKQEAGDILPTLKLSYDILPSQLKQCFTYCRLFPKDYEFKPIDLIDLWMAQGFLKSPYNRSMEDVGRDYFMELVWGSFFQDIEKDVYGNVIMCKMHDLMHDLAQKEAGSNFALVDNSNTATYCHGEVLHVSIYKDEVSKWVGEAHSRARSLLCFEAVKEDLIKDISRNFRNTRVLWLPEGVHPKEVPKEIGKLNHLRSLNLSFSTFESLTPSISKLYNLETLNLEQCRYLIELPRGITELVRLRHLNIKWCCKLTHMPMGIGKLTNLEMLSDFIVGEKGKDDADGLDELSKLKGLTNDLKLSHLERLGKGTNGSFPIKSLNLLSLELHWDWDAKEDKQVPTHSEEEKEAILDRLQPHSDLKGLIIRGYMGCTFSSWVFQLHELVVLEIWDCKYCTYLSPIHQLPFLKSLHLLRLSGLEYIEGGYMSSTFFPSLQKIKMYGLPNFKGWVNLQGNNSQGKEIPEEGDDFLLPVFPTVTTVTMVTTVITGIPIYKSHIGECPRLSYVGAEEGHLSLINVEEKYIHKWLRSNVTFQEVPLNNEVKATPSLRFLSSVPFTELKSLEIGGFEGTTWRAIIKCLPNLERLKISNCSEKDLASVLVIEGVARTATLPWWFQHLSGLKILTIQNCDGLYSLWRDGKLDLNGELDGIRNNMDIPELLVSTTLRELIIQHSKLEFLPWWIGYLRNIETLYICNWENLKALPECLCHLTSLQNLVLSGCKALESLSRKVSIHLISTLRKWIIFGCEKLDLNGELYEKDDAACNSQLTMVPNIRDLTISDKKAEFLPWWVEHLKNLETLNIHGWNNLKALPEWLCNLTSLKRLFIINCPLVIGERCKENGEDGPKIAHIDDVYVEIKKYRLGGQWKPAAL